ncbi:MAG: DUF1772 domain-containing protein [Pseudonocardiaceae bacterium]
MTFNQHDEDNRLGSSAISANQSVKALIAPFAAQRPRATEFGTVAEVDVTRIKNYSSRINDRSTGREARPAQGARAGVAAVAIAATGAFAGGELLTQTVLVPHWLELDPAEFFAHFKKYGPATGATLFPIELLATLLLGVVLVSAVRGRSRGRLAWGIALSGMVGTVLLLPIYFLGANDALLSRAVPLQEVGSAIRSWYLWNWVRTGLALLAVISSCVALGAADSRRGNE